MKSQDESNEQRASFEGKLRFEWRGIVQRLKEPIFYGRFRVESGVCSLFGRGSMVLNESIQKNISWGLVCRLKYVLADEPRFKNVYSIIGATSVARYFNRPLLFHRPCTQINPSTVVKKIVSLPFTTKRISGNAGCLPSLRFLAKRFCSLVVALFGRITRSFYFVRGFAGFKAVKIHKKREFVRLLEFFRLALDSRGIRLFFRAK